MGNVQARTEFVERRVGDRRISERGASVLVKADAKAATALQLGPVAKYLDAEDTIEVCVNRPGEVLVETRKGWVKHAVPELDYVRLERLAMAVASLTDQTWSPLMPVLSGTLPDGCRLQIVGPPAVAPGSMSLTIRKPSTSAFSVDELDSMGLFAETEVMGAVDKSDRLGQLLSKQQIAEFLKTAVRRKQNIIIAGATGSGKTTLSKALIAEVPLDERILTIEDTPELVVPHENRVAMYYAKGMGKKLGPKDLLESALRMRPDRIFLAELRDGTAFYYLRSVNSGHPGSITTVHAGSCAFAIEQLTLLVGESDGGARLGRDDTRSMLMQMIDVVVQCKRQDGKFLVTEIDFIGGRRA
jgi:type IV secretion system protein VirB11